MNEAPPPPRRVGPRIAIILILLTIAVLGYAWVLTR